MYALRSRGCAADPEGVGALRSLVPSDVPPQHARAARDPRHRSDRQARTQLPRRAQRPHGGDRRGQIDPARCLRPGAGRPRRRPSRARRRDQGGVTRCSTSPSTIPPGGSPPSPRSTPRATSSCAGRRWRTGGPAPSSTIRRSGCRCCGHRRRACRDPRPARRPGAGRSRLPPGDPRRLRGLERAGGQGRGPPPGRCVPRARPSPSTGSGSRPPAARRISCATPSRSWATSIPCRGRRRRWPSGAR